MRLFKLFKRRPKTVGKLLYLMRPVPTQEMVNLLFDTWNSPLVQALGGVRESNRYHNEQSVLAHTFEVVRAMIQIDFLASDLAESVKTWRYGPSAGGLTNLEFQVLFAITHDIGKCGKVVKLPDGTTKSAGHEEHSIELLPGLFDYLAEKGHLISEEAKRYLTFLVRNHGVLYEALLKEGTTYEEFEREANRVLKERGFTTFDQKMALMVNIVADLQAGTFTKTHKKWAADFLLEIIRQWPN